MQEASKKDFTKLLLDAKSNALSNDISLKDNFKRIEKAAKDPGPKNKEVIIEEKSSASNTPQLELKCKGRNKPHCRACGGKVKKNSEDSVNHSNRNKECTQCKKDVGSDQMINQSEESKENSGSEISPTNNDRLRSGHARTHSIVINLDDNNRFTDEVTV